MSTFKDSIRIKRGMSAELPQSLPLGELAFCIDTRELWVGSGDGLALKRVTNTEITKFLENWEEIYTTHDEKFETKYIEVSTQFATKFDEICKQFSVKSDSLDRQFADKFEEICVQFSDKYAGLEAEYAKKLHNIDVLSSDNKESIDLLKRDIGTTENIEDLKQINNLATDTLNDLQAIREDLESDISEIGDFKEDVRKAHIDYSGTHHEKLKDSMDANVDFIMGEFNSVTHTGEYITAQDTILRHIKRAEMRGHTELNCIKEPSGQDLVLPYEFEDTQSLTLQDTKESGAVNIVLKGNTEVNVLKNPMRDYVVPYEFEEGYTATLTDTKETGSIQSAILSGQTLVNLSQFHLLFDIQPSSVTTTGVSWYQQLSSQYVSNSMIKPNTKYIVKFGKNTPSRLSQIYISGMWSDGWKGHNSIIQTKDTITSTSNYQMSWSDGEEITQEEWSKVEVMIIEYQEGMENWDIPYFEGMQSVRMPVLTTTGKNLFDFESFKEEKNRVNTGGAYSSFELKLKPSTQYSFNRFTGDGYGSTCYFAFNTVQGSHLGNLYWLVHSDNENINNQQGRFTTDDTGIIYISGIFNDNNLNKTFELIQNLIIVEGDTIPTSYEPYKSNILSCNEEVTLRGIGEVKDTLDGNTGELTQRIGEVVLDGSEKWRTRNGDIIKYFDTDIENIFDGNLKISCISNKLQCYTGHEIHSKEIYGLGASTNTIKLRIPNCLTVDELKLWLSQNPITVQYELATPIVKTVDLSILDQDGLSVPALSTYNEVTHISTSSQEGSLLPSVSSKTPEFPVMIKPNTKYSIVADTTTNGFDEIPLTYNLGGAEVETSVGEKLTVITTPSTLTNETFKVTGTGMKLSNVMILEKDLTGKEIPNYSEGINVSKISEIKTTGKNLFNAYACTLDKSSHPSLIMEVKNSNSIRVALLDSPTGWRAGFINYQLEPNSWYKIRCTVTGDLGLKELSFSVPEVTGWNPDARGCAESNNFLGHIRTLDSGIVKMRFNGSGIDSTTFDLTYSNIQIEKVENKDVAHSSYEAYKESKVTFPEIELNGLEEGSSRVEDTFNVSTGEFTKRIGKRTLNGSEYWLYATGTNGEIRFNLPISDFKNYDASSNGKNLICDKLPKTTFTIDGNNYGVSTWCNHVILYTEHLNVNDLKQWLSENPLTIYYELAEPITTKLDITITNQNGAKVAKLSTFNTITNFTSKVPEGALNPIISHKDLEYEVLLKPNTQYSIITNPVSNGHTNSPISFDLGGQKVETLVGETYTIVTTPTTLTHNKLLMRGRGIKLGNGVMVIEGDKTGMSFNHFDGMKSVQSPVVYALGRNLFDKEAFYNDWKSKQPTYIYKEIVDGEEVLKIHNLNLLHTDSSGFKIKVKKNTSYTLKMKAKKAGESFTNTSLIIRHSYDNNYVNAGSVKQEGWINLKSTFTAERDYITVCSAFNANDYFYIKDVELVETSLITSSFNPNKVNTLTLPEVKLNSLPNGIYDTLNVVTGDYVRKTGQITLAELSELVSPNATVWSPANTHGAYQWVSVAKLINANYYYTSVPNMISDKYVWDNGWHGGKEDSLDLFLAISNDGHVRLNVNKKLINPQDPSSVTSQQLLNWGNENADLSTTIIYELLEPVVTKLDLAWKDGKLFAYDGITRFYVDIDGGHLQPVLDIDVPTDIVAELSRLRAEKTALETSKASLESQITLLDMHNKELVSQVKQLSETNTQLANETKSLRNQTRVNKNNLNYTKSYLLEGQKVLEFNQEELQQEQERTRVEQEAQDHQIINSMLASTEIFELVLGMFPTDISNQSQRVGGESSMVEVYVTLIVAGEKTLEQVPAIIRPKVEAQLKALGVLG